MEGGERECACACVCTYGCMSMFVIAHGCVWVRECTCALKYWCISITRAYKSQLSNDLLVDFQDRRKVLGRPSTVCWLFWIIFFYCFFLVELAEVNTLSVNDILACFPCRFWYQEHHVFLIGSSSPYYKIKPKDVEPIALPKL